MTADTPNRKARLTPVSAPSPGLAGCVSEPDAAHRACRHRSPKRSRFVSPLRWRERMKSCVQNVSQSRVARHTASAVYTEAEGKSYNSEVTQSPRHRRHASLSVFFPAYNDAPSLPILIRNAFQVLDRYVEDFEIIVVNDGSHDDTGQVLDQLRQQYWPWLRVITHPANRGYGGALRSGFENARKEWVFYTDGDGQ